MAKKTCGQVNIPTVNNTKRACEQLFSTDCVIVDKQYNKLDNISGNDLTKLLENLNSRLAYLDNVNFQLETRIEVLEQKITDLGG